MMKDVLWKTRLIDAPVSGMHTAAPVTQGTWWDCCEKHWYPSIYQIIAYNAHCSPSFSVSHCARITIKPEDWWFLPSTDVFSNPCHREQGVYVSLSPPLSLHLFFWFSSLSLTHTHRHQGRGRSRFIAHVIPSWEANIFTRLVRVHLHSHHSQGKEEHRTCSFSTKKEPGKGKRQKKSKSSISCNYKSKAKRAAVNIFFLSLSPSASLTSLSFCLSNVYSQINWGCICRDAPLPFHPLGKCLSRSSLKFISECKICLSLSLSLSLRHFAVAPQRGLKADVAVFSLPSNPLCLPLFAAYFYSVFRIKAHSCSSVVPFTLIAWSALHILCYFINISAARQRSIQMQTGRSSASVFVSSLSFLSRSIHLCLMFTRWNKNCKQRKILFSSHTRDYFVCTVAAVWARMHQVNHCECNRAARMGKK